MNRSTISRGVPMEADRRALRDIKNFMGVAAANPCAVRKRDLPSKLTEDDKSSKRLIGLRPLTRSVAASLPNPPQQPCQPVSTSFGAIGCERQLKHLSSVPNADENVHIAIGVDGIHLTDNFPLPMVEEIKEMMSSELKEVEMKDQEDCLPDIDSCDSNDPLSVAEYVEDIYKFYRQTEDTGCVSPDYMSNQFDINERMRAILIDWLIEVHYKFDLMDQTLFLTVNIIDRFLEHQTVVRKKLQLVGVTAMLLACKYEEVCIPVVEDLVLISDRAYTREEVLEMESLMVNTLQFNLSVPTPYVFIKRFLKAAQSDKKIELLSFYLIELCLVEYQMLKFKPSFLAAAAVYTAQCTLKGFRSWSKASELHSRYSENELMECSKMMAEFHQKAGQGKLTGVFRKYSTSKFGCAAKSESALFLLDI